MMIFKNGIGREAKLDENLIFRIANDDKRALESLYQETKTSVYGFLLSIVRNRHTAEDLMQGTYIQIYMSAASYKPKGKPMAWILTIARNLAFMKLREKSTADISLEPDWGIASADNGIQQTLDRIVLTAAMEVLNEDERQIVMLHDVSGLKHREIAEILQIPLTTTLSKYRRALSKIRKQVEEGN